MEDVRELDGTTRRAGRAAPRRQAEHAPRAQGCSGVGFTGLAISIGRSSRILRLWAPLGHESGMIGHGRQDRGRDRRVEARGRGASLGRRGGDAPRARRSRRCTRGATCRSTTPADAGLMPMAWTESIEVLDAMRGAAERAAADQVRSGARRRARRDASRSPRAAPRTCCATAAADADLLVVGNRGRGNIASALLGSTSAELADSAPCPVVIVRAHGTTT